MNRLFATSIALLITLVFCFGNALPCQAQYRSARQTTRNYQHRGNQQRSYRVVRRPVYQGQRSQPQYRTQSRSGQRGVQRPRQTVSTNSRSYRLDAGDIVSLIVNGVLGDYTSAPIHWPRNGNDIQPSIGFPMPVRDDGTLSLPLIDPVNVRGMTILEAEDAIEKAYLDAEILKGKNLVTCHLMRKRTVQVMVVHNEYPRSLVGENNQTITKVNIPADDATPLRALAEAGGYFDQDNVQVLRSGNAGQFSGRSTGLGRLGEGDIVNAPLPSASFYYAGGLLNNGRYEIPADVQLNAAQAIAQSGGSILGSSGLGPSEFILTRGNQTRSYNVNWLMNNPNAVMILPGDTINIRQTQSDILGNTAIDLLRFGILRGF